MCAEKFKEPFVYSIADYDGYSVVSVDTHIHSSAKLPDDWSREDAKLLAKKCKLAVLKIMSEILEGEN